MHQTIFSMQWYLSPSLDLDELVVSKKAAPILLQRCIPPKVGGCSRCVSDVSKLLDPKPGSTKTKYYCHVLEKVDMQLFLVKANDLWRTCQDNTQNPKPAPNFGWLVLYLFCWGQASVGIIFAYHFCVPYGILPNKVEQHSPTAICCLFINKGSSSIINPKLKGILLSAKLAGKKMPT